MSPVNFFKNFLIYLKYKSEYSFCKLNLFFDNDSSKKIGYNGKKKVIGYPIGYDITNLKINPNMATIIHQPFIADASVDMTYEEEFKFYKEIVNSLKKNGYENIFFLLHPRENINNYLRFGKLKVQVVQGIKNQDNLLMSGLVIGHYSSLLQHSIFIGKNVIKVHYPKVKNNFNAVDSISLDTFSKCKDLSEHYINIDEKKVSTINYNVFVNRILNFSKFYN